jgi:hypothetical protein
MYARAADLGHGVAFYAAVGVSVAVLTLAAFGVALAAGVPHAVGILLGVAALLTVLHSAATGRAAPTMFRIGQADDNEAALEPLLTRFARVSLVRAALQVAAFLVVVAALTAGL